MTTAMLVTPLSQALAAVTADEFTEADAHILLDTIAARYGWAFALWTRASATNWLHANLPGEPGRDLTTDEWARLVDTDDWSQHLPTYAYRAIEEGMYVPQAIIAAGLECMNCETALTAPPALTGRLCDHCRIGPAGQPVTVDPVTTGIYWIDTDTDQLVYVAPNYCAATHEFGDPQPFDWTNDDHQALSRATQARVRLTALPAAEAAPWPASPWHRRDLAPLA